VLQRRCFGIRIDLEIWKGEREESGRERARQECERGRELPLQIQECLYWRGEILSFQKIAAENKVRKSKAKFYLVFLEFSADPIFLMLPNTGKLNSIFSHKKQG
jgi:hypothetical protein